MKRLYLVRHGKSSWDHPELRDAERPLKKRGYSDGRIMGEAMLDKNIKADAIITSPAMRAKTTAAIIARILDFDTDRIVEDDDLYFTGVGSILGRINEVDQSVDDLFLFGHNPDTTEMANNFTDTPIYNVPTTGVVCIEFDITDWNEATLQNGKLLFFDFPKRYK